MIWDIVFRVVAGKRDKIRDLIKKADFELRKTYSSGANGDRIVLSKRLSGQTPNRETMEIKME